jgi:dTDP-4-dehydrorhamnose 3,5-epimerase
MNLIATEIPDLWILEPKVFYDERGFFSESYNQKTLESLGINYQFIQDNHSASTYGVLRGLHYQKAPYAQTKLVRVVKGAVIDVAVDLRKGSPTFLKSFAIELSEENKKQLLIPQGFAHGFVVITPKAEFLYKCDNYYNKESEGGIIFNDPSLNIDWGIPESDIILSDKDRRNTLAVDADFDFPFENFTQTIL